MITLILIYLLLGSWLAAYAMYKGGKVQNSVPLHAYFVTVIVWPYTVYRIFTR